MKSAGKKPTAPRRTRKAPAPDPRRRRAASSPDLPRRSTTVSMREDLRARVQAIADARGWTFGAVLEEMLAAAVDWYTINGDGGPEKAGACNADKIAATGGAI